MAYNYTVSRTIVSNYSVAGTTGGHQPTTYGYGISIADQFNAISHHSDASITGIRITATWSGSPASSSYGTAKLAVDSYYNGVKLRGVDISSSGGYAAISTSPLTSQAWVYFIYTTASSYKVTLQITFAYTSNVAPASTFSCGNATLGSAHTVTISPASSDLSHRITWSCGSYSHSENVAAGTTSKSYTIPASWGAAIPSANSGTMNVKVETLQGSTVTGSSSQSKTVSVPSYSVSASLAASVVDGYNGYYRQYKSKAKLTPTVSSSYGATISSCTITGHAISGSISGTSGGTTGILTKIGNQTYTLSVRDSRGKTGTATVTINVQACGAVDVTSAPNITAGETSVVKWSHAYMSRLTCTVTWAIGNQSHTVTVAKGATQASYTVPVSWANQETSSLSGDITVTIVSRDENGDTTGTKEWHVGMFIPSYTISATGTVTKIDDFHDLLVQGASKVTLAVTASSSYGATITSYEWSGCKYVSGKTTASVTTSVLDESGEFRAYCRIVDSRKRTETVELHFTVSAYRKPQILNLSAFRSDSTGTEDPAGESLAIITDYTWTDLGVNSLTATAELMPDGGTWETLGTGFDSGELVVYKVGQLSRTQKYTVRVLIDDELSVEIMDMRITVGETYMFWGDESFGLGAYPLANDQFYIGDDWTMYVHGKEILDLIYPVHCVIMRDQATDVAAELGFGTWTLVTSSSGIYYYARTA